MRVAYVDSSWSGKSPLMGGSTAAGHGSLLLLGVGGMCNGYGIVDDDALRLAGRVKTDGLCSEKRATPWGRYRRAVIGGPL